MIVEVWQRDGLRRGPLVGVPVFTALVALAWVNYPLHNLPFGHETKSGEYSWLGITSNDSSFIPSWVYWNYSGYQNPARPARRSTSL